mgnify:CR=1 FL=1
MKILIFGNSGFIGKEIEKFLINLGHLVIGVSRNGKSEYNFDISNFANFKQITEVPDIIINSASILPANNKDSFEANYLKKIFEVNLWYDRNKHWELYEKYNFEDAFKIAFELSELLNIDLLDATVPNNFKWIDKKASKETGKIVYSD